MRHFIEDLAISAGKAVMEHYPLAEGEVDLKGDGSPVTVADLAAHRIITEGLETFSSIPIVSEESYNPTLFPPAKIFWLVDPLDGTRDFINNTGHFTVNIALIEEGLAKAGVVYAPASDDIYSAFDGIFKKNGKQLAKPSINSPIVGGSSHFHKGEKLKGFFERNNISKVLDIGSSLKFCLLAEGVLDIYPRLSPTSQWDTAAGQAIAEAAGCEVIDFHSREPLRYGSLPIKNPSFIAANKGVNWV